MKSRKSSQRKSKRTALSHAQDAARAASIGDSAYSRGNFASARDAYLNAARLHPQQADYVRKAGIAEWAGGNLEAAGMHLRHALQVDPLFAVGRSSLGEWLLARGMPGEALAATSRAIELAPQRGDVVLAHAWTLESAGRHDESWGLLQQLLSRKQYTPSLAHLYGRMALHRGQQLSALDLINRYLQSGNLLPFYASNLNVAAAELLDSLGRYDEAFAHAERGNAIRGRRYKPADHQAFTDRTLACFTRQKAALLPKATGRSDFPVFIVGVPRSGTTLVEQVLASHPQVFGAGELYYLSHCVARIVDSLSVSPDDYPRCLDLLTAGQVNETAGVYLRSLRALNPAARRITDKMPLNFAHLGLVSMLFPESRVIHCVRDPLDTCLSCFMTPFSAGHDFKYDLTDLGHFYRQYQRLMSCWKGALDLRILDVCYEDLVADTEAQCRRMIQFLELPWDDACLRFYENSRPTATASGQQVRRPIYKTSVGRSKRYEKHLGPLKSALELYRG
jgi:tetratricopeptide (TPR) repeat protein